MQKKIILLLVLVLIVIVLTPFIKPAKKISAPNELIVKDQVALPDFIQTLIEKNKENKDTNIESCPAKNGENIYVVTTWLEDEYQGADLYDENWIKLEHCVGETSYLPEPCYNTGYCSIIHSERW